MKGGWWFEKVRRGVRTVYFVVVMVASLVVVSLPVVVAIIDGVLPCLLIPGFACVKCYGFREHLRRYDFKSSLMDIPIVSILRSLIITCVYLLCDGQALSYGPYFETVSLCSFISTLLLSVKACVFSVNSQLEAEASISLSRKRLHLKKSWGMPVLFLSSVVFALGHIVVAYQTRCKARRKLGFHRIDPEAVLSYKMVFSGYQKVPRSPTPTAGKSFRTHGEMRKKLPGITVHDDGELPVSVLADVDSLFVSCQGLRVHYKLIIPGSPSTSFSSITFFDQSKLSIPPKAQYNIHRSISNQFHSTSLYTPLLASSPTSPISESVPILSLNDTYEDEDLSKVGPTVMERDIEANARFGIVLVHGFGGGVFSWRNIMGVLASQNGCAVVAFDRPGGGLTSRPRQKDWEENQSSNPYKLENQVDLLISFCLEMGFSSVMLVGHDDGGLLALKAAQKIQTSTNSINLEIKGVVLLNVSLSRELVPAFARILLRTSLGKKHMVRPLLRTEIIQVVNRRAWYDPTKLTSQVLSLYKVPLHTEGWDEALHEIGKLSFETVLSTQNATSMLKAIETLPVLVIAGAEDVLVPLKSVQTMASKLINAITIPPLFFDLRRSDRGVLCNSNLPCIRARHCSMPSVQLPTGNLSFRPAHVLKCKNNGYVSRTRSDHVLKVQSMAKESLLMKNAWPWKFEYRVLRLETIIPDNDIPGNKKVKTSVSYRCGGRFIKDRKDPCVHLCNLRKLMKEDEMSEDLPKIPTNKDRGYVETKVREYALRVFKRRFLRRALRVAGDRVKDLLAENGLDPYRVLNTREH